MPDVLTGAPDYVALIYNGVVNVSECRRVCWSPRKCNASIPPRDARVALPAVVVGFEPPFQRSRKRS